MDIHCPLCGEPWDHDELHFMVEHGTPIPYTRAVKLFQKLGCRAFGCGHSRPLDEKAAQLARAAYAACGDDMDGAASLLDDLL